MEKIRFYDVGDLNDQDKYFVLTKYVDKVTNMKERNIVEHPYFKCIMMSMTTTWEQKYEMLTLMIDYFAEFAALYAPDSPYNEDQMFLDENGEPIEHFYFYKTEAHDLSKIDDHFQIFDHDETNLYYEFLRQYQCVLNVDDSYVYPEKQTFDGIEISSIRDRMKIDDATSPYITINGNTTLLSIVANNQDMTSTYYITGSHERIIISGHGKINIITDGHIDVLYIISVTLNYFNVMKSPRKIVFNEVYFDRETRKAYGKTFSGETKIFDTKNIKLKQDLIDKVVVFNCISETELRLDGKIVKDFGFYSKDGNVQIVDISQLDNNIFLKTVGQMKVLDPIRYDTEDNSDRIISLVGNFMLSGLFRSKKLKISDNKTYANALRQGIENITRDAKEYEMTNYFDITEKGIPIEFME